MKDAGTDVDNSGTSVENNAAERAESSEQVRHTPGPWVWARAVTRNGRLVVLDATSLDTLAEVTSGTEDARLIAAAPDLLEVALKLTARWVRYEGSFKVCVCCGAGVAPGEQLSAMVHEAACPVPDALAAIAKARETPHERVPARDPVVETRKTLAGVTDRQRASWKRPGGGW